MEQTGTELRSGFVAAAFSVAVMMAAASASCAGTTKLTAAEIVARNAAARGGSDAWHKVETLILIGHVESAHAPVPDMPFELDQKRPNKTRMQIRALEERSERVFNGAQGWKVRAGRGQPEPFTPEELKFARTGHGIEGPLIGSAANGSAVTLEGVDDLAGRKAYHLRVRPAQGADEDVWVGADDYLDIRYDRMTEGPKGGRRVSTTYGDYRKVDGLQIPFLIETGGGEGTTPDRLRIERAVLNSPLDDAMFENPAVPRSRRGRWSAAMQQGTLPPPGASSESRGSETR